jgi:triosephosphate isomerase
MATRKPLAAGNWKMNLVGAEAGALARGIASALRPAVYERADVALFPAFPLLAPVREALAGTPIQLGAQNMSWEDKGALTGEVSAAMLRDAGCGWVILGHSERRHILGETDAMIRRKLDRAHASGLQAILCVGETGEERRAGRTLATLDRQLAAAFEGWGYDRIQATAIAYEPVWAIGTGVNATPGQAQEAHAHIRSRVGEMTGTAAAALIRILYGGSVSPENIDALIACPDVDGALVGGASLQADKFARIVNGTASKTR